MDFRLLIKTCTFTLGALAMATSSHATLVYKSIGEFGEVKYSQFPPKPGVKAEVIELRNNGRQMVAGELAGSTNTQGNAENGNNATANVNTETNSETSRQGSQVDKDKENRCQTLRTNLTNLNSEGRIYEPDGNGGRKYLDNREIELKREKIQTAIQQYCAS